MAITCAAAASNKRPAQYGASAVGSPVFLWFTLTPTAAWATNDQYKFTKNPRGHIVIDLVIDWPDMDSGANLVYDVGLYEDTGVDTTIGTVVDTDCYIAASTTARAVGRERIGAALQAALAAAITVSESDRVVVATATTGGAGTAAKAITGYAIAIPKTSDIS